MNITPLELKVLQNIVDSEYQDGSSPIDFAVWSFSATDSRKDLAGALGSLVKKGLAKCQQTPGDDEVCWITQAGYDCLIQNKS